MDIVKLCKRMITLIVRTAVGTWGLSPMYGRPLQAAIWVPAECLKPERGGGQRPSLDGGWIYRRVRDSFDVDGPDETVASA